MLTVAHTEISVKSGILSWGSFDIPVGFRTLMIQALGDLQPGKPAHESSGGPS